MKINGYAMSLLLGIAFTSTAGAQCPIKDSIMGGSIFAKIGAMLIKPALKPIAKKLDHTESGGAPLLGVNGVFMISHGSSKAKEIKTAIKIATDLVERKIIEQIRQTVEIEGAVKYEYDE